MDYWQRLFLKSKFAQNACFLLYCKINPSSKRPECYLDTMTDSSATVMEPAGRTSSGSTVDLDLWGSAAGLATPYVAVDLNRLSSNLDRVATIARSNAVKLRPHVKTHKCVEIARMQMDRGAVGVTASKPQEAHVFIDVGVPSVTVAYPIVDPRTALALLESAEANHCDLRFVVDSLVGVQAIASAVSGSRSKASLLIEIDVGLERCGVKPGSTSLEQIGTAIRDSRDLRLKGVLSHAGHAYAALGKCEISVIADEERRLLRLVVDQLAVLGIEVEEVSVGSTPTVLAAESLAGVTEIRPGNYVFLDSTALRLGIADIDDIALGVVSTVVSVNERYCIIDAGSKVLSSDTGPHGSGGGAFGLCFELDPSPFARGSQLRVNRLSEEHGFVEHGGLPIPIGARMVVFPNHSCPAVNLADRLIVLEQGQDPVSWAVAARGKST